MYVPYKIYVKFEKIVLLNIVFEDHLKEFCG